MSEMRWKDLRDTDFSVMRALAEQFDSYIADMVEQAESLTEDVVKKHLSTDCYEGAAADTVREQIGHVAESFLDDLSEYANVKIKATLEDACEELLAAQESLVELLVPIEAGKYKVTGPAGDHGLELSEDLLNDIAELSPPASLLARSGLTEADLHADTGRHIVATELKQAAEAEAEELAEVLRAIMGRAHEAEAEAVGILRSILDDPAEQPPPLGVTYDDLIDDYEAAADVRNVEFLKELAEGTSEATANGINEWWDGLSEAERHALIDSHPELIGGLDGIPSDTRNEVNRDLLGAEIDDLESQLEGLRERELAARADPEADNGALMEQIDELEQRLSNAASLQHALDARGENVYLLDFDTAEDGQAAVSIGDPDSADHTAVYVPGTTSDLGGVDGLIGDAEVLQDAARNWSPDDETAVVMWLEYDAPDNAVPVAQDGPFPPEAWGTEQAVDATSGLDSFLEGISAAHDGESHTTLIGHSYGSATVGATAAAHQIAADQVIDFASPGLMVDAADELSVGGDDVWSTRADGDVIDLAVTTGAMGADPIADAFGDNTFEADAIGDSGTEIHSGYLKNAPDGEPNQALDTMALIITGQTEGLQP
ncbi:alpha/beta hydrolase family protein [Glycomyces tarimensis]